MKQTLDELNALPGVTATGSVTVAERFPLPDQAAYDRYQELATDMTPKQAMARAAAESEARTDLSSALAREAAIRAACETYNRRQVAAFADYRVSADRAWQDYQRAMHAADNTYDATMAAAGDDYDQTLRRHA